jgi:hypothetical protein
MDDLAYTQQLLRQEFEMNLNYVTERQQQVRIANLNEF